MNNIEIYQWINAIGWTLLHSLWQTLILGFLVWLILRFISKDNARVRYLAAGLGLLAIFLTSTITFLHYIDNAPSTEAVINKISPEILLTYLGTKSEISHFWSFDNIQIEPYLPTIVNIWFIGVFILTVHLSISYLRSVKLRKHMAYPLRNEILVIAQEIANKFGLTKKITFKESGQIKIPSLIGYFKPVVLIPVSLLSGIPKNQLEIVIAHELAHIYRHDYLIQFIQNILELLFFYHPIVWWLSSVVNTEREHICDDLAVKVCGESLTLIKALNNMEAIRKKQHEMVLGFSGKKGNVLNRVQRILHSKQTTPRYGKFMLSGLFVFLFSGLLLVSNIAISGNSFIGKQFFSKVNIVDKEKYQNPMNSIDDQASTQKALEINQDTPLKIKHQSARKPVLNTVPESRINANHLLSDTLKEKKEVKDRVHEIIESQREALESALKELKESDFDFSEIQKELKEELQDLKMDKVEFQKEMREHQLELQEHLKEIEEEDFLIEFEHEFNESKLELEEHLKEIHENSKLSEIEKKELKKEIQSQIEKFNSAVFKEKMRRQIERSKEIIQKEMERMKATGWEKNFKNHQETIQKELDQISTKEFQDKIHKEIKSSKEKIEEQLKKLNTPEYRKELEEKLQKEKKEKVKIKVSKDKQPLVIVEGKRIPSSEINDIDPNSIQEVNVIKDSSAITTYGKEAKNGVIEISLKKDKKHPLLILDGKILKNTDINSIDPEIIKNITVLKNEKAVAIYGSDAIDGAIIINTKKERIENDKVQIKIGKKAGKEDPLYVVDGEIISHRKMKKINPKQIENLTVIKGENALNKYGEKAKNGVIEIVLKN
eukprot:TRINITY_DN2831_c1_g3_i1.p1 TRINITY_DN2831_c1_g3~~TRINITY_DN2831_c1_g3_i1.p1  ORF type:complete len:832 (+),score=82.85 TRINITY_DN2831_c1_g3_i1:2238-4733(+)